MTQFQDQDEIINNEPQLEDESIVDEEAQPKTFRHRVRSAMGHGFRKAVDATILNTHPSCAPIDGMPRMDGEFMKDTVDATILNKHPGSAPVDHTVNVFWRRVSWTLLTTISK